MTIGITAASGQLGHLVIEGLKRNGRGGEVVALARTLAKLDGLGVATREADYARPETLATAFAGMDTLLFISSGAIGDDRTIQHRNVVKAAAAAGVRWIVYTSLLRADTTPLVLGPSHAATEAAIEATGTPHTFLRNGWYTENYTGALGGALQAGVLIGGAGDGRISSAARADYAAAAVAVLTGEGHVGRTYELAGDEAWTLADLATEVSRQTGRSIGFQNLSEADHAAALTGFGLPAPVAGFVAGLDAAAAQDALFEDGRQLSRLIGRPTTPLSASVAEALSAQGAKA